MLLHGMDSAEISIAQAAIDVLLSLKDELPDPIGTLVSLVSRTLSLGLPRASGHLLAIGKLLSDAWQDPPLATFLADACMADASAVTAAAAAPGGSARGGGVAGGERGVDGRVVTTAFSEFAAFLAHAASSSSLSDQVKSDVVFVAMELLQCCLTAGASEYDPRSSAAAPQGAYRYRPSPPATDDPFVSVMLAVPRLLARRSSSDEPLQLHSVTYVATAAAYCRHRADSGVPGWPANNVAGVPEVLVALFDGGKCSERLSRDGIASINAQWSGGLGGVLKALLMSSSYRVRVATSRLITTVCNNGGGNSGDQHLSYNPAASTGADRGVAERSQLFGAFFREKLIAAGVTDFLFEAMNKEREGTPRHYLEAVEVLSLSPVEFFHSRNFSMKFVAPILLNCARDEGRERWQMDHGDDVGVSNDEQEESRVFAISSRLLLQALVIVPPTSTAGFVEKILGAAAASHRSLTAQTRAIGVAADVLNLVASGDALLPQDPGPLLDAVAQLLRSIEQALQCTVQDVGGCVVPVSSLAARGISPRRPCTPSPSNVQGHGADDDGRTASAVEHTSRSDALLLHAARAVESLLRMVERWVLSGYPGFSRGNHRSGVGRRSSTNKDITLGEPGISLADLVFGSYERILVNQHELTVRSDSIGHSIAFASCIGGAIDCISAVLESKDVHARFIGTRSSCSGGNVRRAYLATAHRERNIGRGGDEHGDDGEHCSKDEKVFGENETDVESEYSAAAATASSCLESILATAIASDLIVYLLDLYMRCGGNYGAQDVDTGTRIAMTSVGVTRLTQQSAPQESDDEGGPGHYSTAARKLLTEVLQSLLFVQGWVNGLCSNDADRPLHARGSAENNGSFPGLSETLRHVLPLWDSRRDQHAVPFDHHVISLLGTDADNGSLCKLMLLLMSLSASNLGILHPHLSCRVDSAITILRYIKNVPDAVFCLNRLAQMITTTGDSGSSAFIGALPLGEDLAAAVEDVLLRFSVAEMAFTAVPLSAAAISLALSAGCLAFAGDWLITATLDHIKCVLLDLGLSLNDQGHHCDVPALNGILEAAVRRWGRVLSIDGSTGKLQEGDSDGTISRLSSVLLLAPDDFLLLAFDSAGYSQGENSVDSSGDDERRTATTVVDILEAVITSTLTKLSTSIGHYAVLRAGSETGGTGQEAMLLACTSRVLRLASAFLHARCAHAFHCAPSASMDTTFQPASWTSDPRQPSTGETLVRACAGLLQGMFDSRRRGLVGGAEQDDLMINRAAVDALNLLNALLVLLAADATHLPAAFHAESLENALGEARAALVEEGMFSMTERGCNFLDRGPNALAAYLQFCLLWNLLCSQANLTPHRSWGGCGSVEVPFDVLDRIMTMRIVNSDGGCRATWGWSMSLMQAKARWTVLHILAARCIECAAPRRPFSRKQVLSLQLALQGIACEGDARSASAALAAMGALWERYTGVLSPIDLFQQPWNEFTLECCFENA
ncbi:unnamed protein product, partial [Sphacelaria rigidula]